MINIFIGIEDFKENYQLFLIYFKKEKKKRKKTLIKLCRSKMATRVREDLSGQAAPTGFVRFGTQEEATTAT